jgi:hypothetical protein
MPSNVRAFGRVSTLPRRIAPAVEPAPAEAPAAAEAPALAEAPDDSITQELSALDLTAQAQPPRNPPFAACYDAALEGIPPSLLRTLQDRLERRKYDLGTVSEVIAGEIQKTRASYLKKREAGRVRAATKRAAKRAESARDAAEAPQE